MDIKYEVNSPFEKKKLLTMVTTERTCLEKWIKSKDQAPLLGFDIHCKYIEDGGVLGTFVMSVGQETIIFQCKSKHGNSKEFKTPWKLVNFLAKETMVVAGSNMVSKKDPMYAALGEESEKLIVHDLTTKLASYRLKFEAEKIAAKNMGIKKFYPIWKDKSLYEEDDEVMVKFLTIVGQLNKNTSGEIWKLFHTC